MNGLTIAELARIREFLLIASSHLRQLVDRGPRMSVALGDTLMAAAAEADTLRQKLT